MKETLRYPNLLRPSFLPIIPEIKASLLYLLHASESCLARLLGLILVQEIPHQVLQRGVLVTQVLIRKFISLSDHGQNLHETKWYHHGT